MIWLPLIALVLLVLANGIAALRGDSEQIWPKSGPYCFYEREDR
jgi:hypothetical protein